MLKRSHITSRVEVCNPGGECLEGVDLCETCHFLFTKAKKPKVCCSHFGNTDILSYIFHFTCSCLSYTTELASPLNKADAASLNHFVCVRIHIVAMLRATVLLICEHHRAASLRQ